MRCFVFYAFDIHLHKKNCPINTILFSFFCFKRLLFFSVAFYVFFLLFSAWTIHIFFIIISICCWAGCRFIVILFHIGSINIIQHLVKNIYDLHIYVKYGWKQLDFDSCWWWAVCCMHICAATQSYFCHV